MDDVRSAVCLARNRARRSLLFGWLLLVALLACTGGHHAQALTEVERFGSNPGQLRMWKHVPTPLTGSAPLVVALHGCTQNARDFAEQSGWRELADRHGFVLLLPEQRAQNNQRLCFNWFNGWALSDLWFWAEWGSDQGRDTGEALSIKQMIDRMKADHPIDTKRVYITGLSAGGGMSAVMLAVYPELFAAGALFAGVPYRCAKTASEALSQCGIDLTQTGNARIVPREPEAWAREVRDATGHRGPWPRVSIWHGDADQTVIPDVSRELLAQWTAVHDIDADADQTSTTNRLTHRAFRDAQGATQVETFHIAGMGHGVPINPGGGAGRCGQPGAHAFAVGVCAAHVLARSWGLAP